MKEKMLSITPTEAGLKRLAWNAERWGTGWFYLDNDRKRIAVSNVERPELDDLFVLQTNGAITANEIHDILLGELM